MNLTSPDQEFADVDTMLSRFFKAQKPDPWPPCRALRQPTKPRRPLPRRPLPRLALAASLVLFFLAYFLLSGLFPRTTSTPLPGDQIGSKPGVHHRIHNPAQP